MMIYVLDLKIIVDAVKILFLVNLRFNRNGI